MLKHLRYGIEALFFYPLYWGIRLLPLSAISAVGASLGRVLKKIRREDALVLSNLGRAFPDMSANEKRAIADRVWENSGRTFLEFMAIDRLNMDQHVRITGAENVDHVLAAGRPIVFISGHLGNWNVSMRVLHTLVDGHVAGIYRKANNPYIEPAINRLYRSFSPHMVTSADDVRGMLRMLGNGTSLGILSDQHNSNGVEVSFMGQKVLAPSGAAFLAWRSGAALIPVSCRRTGSHKNAVMFDVVIEPPIAPPPADTPRQEAVMLLTQNYYSILEKFIIHHPDSWFWLHARFSKYTPSARAPAVG